MDPKNAHEVGPRHGQHHGPREQGDRGEVPHPNGEGAHRLHVQRPQGNLQQHLDLHRGPETGREPYPSGNAHIPVC